MHNKYILTISEPSNYGDNTKLLITKIEVPHAIQVMQIHHIFLKLGMKLKDKIRYSGKYWGFFYFSRKSKSLTAILTNTGRM